MKGRLNSNKNKESWSILIDVKTVHISNYQMIMRKIILNIILPTLADGRLFLEKIEIQLLQPLFGQHLVMNSRRGHNMYIYAENIEYTLQVY